MSVSAYQAQNNEETMQEPLDVFVLRKAVTGSYVVGSYHRAIGPVFLDVFRSVGRHHGLTLDLDRAHRFERSAVDIDAFLAKLDKSNCESGGHTGDFASLCNHSSVTPESLAAWARATPWIEVLAPLPPLYCVHSDRPSSAIRPGRQTFLKHFASVPEKSCLSRRSGGSSLTGVSSR